jgi:hypothetical protein
VVTISTASGTTGEPDNWWSEIWRSFPKATRRLPANLKEEERGIEWSAIAGIGNVLRHDYHKSHPTILWETCQKDLEPLKAAVKHIQVKLGGV